MTQGTEQPPTTSPVAVGRDEGEARWWFDALAVIKATAADTGGLMSIVEVTEPPGAQTPLHVHHREDEAFWILEGDVTLYVGDDTIEAHAGDYAWGPRGIPHRYTVGAAGCRMLFICVPGGFEKLVVEMSEPAGSRALPPPCGGPARHGAGRGGGQGERLRAARGAGLSAGLSHRRPVRGFSPPPDTDWRHGAARRVARSCWSCRNLRSTPTPRAGAAICSSTSPAC